MQLKKLVLSGFKSFAKKSEFLFDDPITAVVGPNGSGKSNVVEAVRFVLGEQSNKSLRSKTGSDLIFKGSNQIGKLNKAWVELTFDNSKRQFSLHNDRNAKLSLDFDEIVLRREVHSDGANTYSINGTEVRLKDIIETIASVNIGSSGHHIISQGEADRLLNANPKERREMIEDALGLKVYQYRIKESVRKLERTQDNIREVDLQRRELAPRLKFLERQVKKIAKAKELQAELETRYQGYLKKESILIERIEQNLNDQAGTYQAGLNAVAGQVQDLQQKISNQESSQEDKLISELEQKLRDLRAEKDTLVRSLGRIEGSIELLQQTASVPTSGPRDVVVSLESVRRTADSVASILRPLESSADVGQIRQGVGQAITILDNFVADQEGEQPQVASVDTSTKQAELARAKENISAQLQSVEQQEAFIAQQLQQVKQSITDQVSQARAQERELYEVKSKQDSIRTKLELVQREIEALSERKQSLQEEVQEAVVLVGPQINNYKDFVIDHVGDITKSEQEDERRKIERIKIKLEDIGAGGGGDIIAEYEEAKHRDEFLEKELGDLVAGMKTLHQVIEDLTFRLSTEFAAGVEKINTQFHEFFTAMFGGGSATLQLVDIKKRKRTVEGEEEIPSDEDLNPDGSAKEEKVQQGIAIKVSLPRKKVAELEMLSGGERSLTSIALLFALSQVNPPPFLILDETDAALDEANSKKYGDMLENLSKYSQLMVVTHNRETMSRAGILYGITVSGGASQVLSIKFDQAAEVAK